MVVDLKRRPGGLAMIKFGTSGWRAVIADEFTFANVRLATQAIAKCLLRTQLPRKVIVGYDTRFLADKFAEQAAAIFNANGFEALLCTRDAPTPAISAAIRHEQAAGGLNVTASHNPPEYCGLKFSTSDGAPALPEVTKEIEAECQSLLESETSVEEPSQHVAPQYDARPVHLSDLRAKVNLDAIADSELKVGYDAIYGTGRDYLDAVLKEHGCHVETIHANLDAFFGGRSPEPSEETLQELAELVVDRGLDLGLATDGDADRFGVLDRDGSFITPNQLIALLVGYLAETRGKDRGVARSVSTSHLVDRVANKLGIPVYETAVGFKFIGEMINKDAIIIGGEESAGLTIRGHYPEKDGILACLLAAEMVATRRASLSEMLEQLYRDVGKVVDARIGVHLDDRIKARLASKLAGPDPSSIGGRPISHVNRTDGVKYIFDDGSWVLIRMSGTEPLARCYAEAQSEQELEVLLESGRHFILN